MSQTAQDLSADDFQKLAPTAAEISVASTGRQTLDDVEPLTGRAITDRQTIRTFARGVDVAVLSLISIIAMSGLNANIFALSLGTAVPYIALPALLAWGNWSAGAYRFPFIEKVLDHMAKVALGLSLTLLAVMAVCALTGWGGSFLYFSTVGTVSWLALMTLHAHYVGLIKTLIRRGQLSENVVIVGATPHAAKLIEKNTVDRELNIVAIFDDRLGRAPRDLHGVPVVGTLDDLLAWDQLPRVDRIIVTVTTQAQTRVRMLIERLRYLPNRVVLLLDLENFNPDGASLAEVADSPAAYVSGAPKDARRAMVKRLSDIFFGVGLAIGFMPIMAVVAVLIKLDSSGPVLFKQKRHGFNNQVIRVWKFRTMRPDKKAEDGVITQVTSDDDRVTRLGKFLRKTSIDELPQLFNVIIGEMSLVGPRPHAVGMTTEETEVHHLVSDYAHRHRVKPGLTGWAQINGSRGPVHTAEEVRERVRLDMEYVNRSSFWFDLYVMIMTAPCLLGDSNDR